jgi:hypothetical protein
MNPRSFGRYSDLEKAVQKLPILLEEKPYTCHLVDILATLGLIRESGVRLTPLFQGATKPMIRKQLRQFMKRLRELAYQIKNNFKTKRAQQQLVKCVRGLYGPTVNALGDVGAVRKANGEPVLPDIHYLTNGFADRVAAGAVSVEELHFWFVVAVKAEIVPLKPRNVGRPRDHIAENVATTLALGYLNLTGRKPGTSKRTDNGGPFWSFLDEIFAILGIPAPGKNAGSQLSTTSRAARAAKSIRTTVRPQAGEKTQDVSIGAMDSDARSFFERYPEAMRIIVD